MKLPPSDCFALISEVPYRPPRLLYEGSSEPDIPMDIVHKSQLAG